MFSHEKLDVYKRSVVLVGETARMVAAWPRGHSVSDHLERAAESIVFNLAEACRTGSVETKQLFVDYGYGSALECAACFDVAHVKGLIGESVQRAGKGRLLEITKMLIGLRKAWGMTQVREDAVAYGSEADSSNGDFQHESLDVYRVCLRFLAWLFGSGALDRVTTRFSRKGDECGTSVLLNIAEGCGRFSVLQRGRFMETANRQSVKMAALLDLCGLETSLTSDQFHEAKSMIERVANMTWAMVQKTKKGEAK
jgi:four helix bundle protein